MSAGRKKKYTKKQLSAAVDAYFASISRTVTVKERYDTGRTDDKGHAIFAERDVLNDAGQPIRDTEYVIPPTVGGLCEYLGITRQTWSVYCDAKENPQFADTATCARGRMHAYLEHELLTRSGKDIKGVMFNLENNYGMAEHVEHELGPKAAARAEVNGMSMEDKLSVLRSIAKRFTEEPEDDGDGE